MPPETSDALPAPVARARPAGTTRPGWRTLVLGGLVLAVVLSTRWVRLNGSPSVPLGLYRLAAVREPLARGTLVVVPVPPSVQAWQSRWVPLLKPVAAVAGEQVCIEQRWLQIQGNWVGPVLHEAHGMALPQWRGCHIVQEGDVFLASAVPNSLDSRYFGPVPITSLTGQATPLFTWR